jgi:hypothetical protein
MSAHAISSESSGQTRSIGRWAELPCSPASSAMRVTGVLSRDALIATTAGVTPTVCLLLEFSPEYGLPYVANVSISSAAADQIAAGALALQMRRGSVVSVAARGLDLRMDHDHAVLLLKEAHTVWFFGEPRTTTVVDDASQPGLFESASH